MSPWLQANPDANSTRTAPFASPWVSKECDITNNPSSIDQNQQLLVRFLNLGAHDVIVPGTGKVAFSIMLASEDVNRTVEVTIEGIPNQLNSQGMRSYQMWDEAKKYFAASPGSKRHPVVGTVAKDLTLADVNLGEFLTSTLWLDLRTGDNDRLHGSGRRIENASEGITIQITKKAQAPGALNIYHFVVMDAQLNIENDRFVSAAY